MDRLFRDSGLIRPKWGKQHFADGSTYGEKTIERAIEQTTEFYEPTAEMKGGKQTDPPRVNSREIRDREGDRVERIEELERRLRQVLTERQELARELEVERARREELEAQLDSTDSDDGSRFRTFLGDLRE